VHPETGGLTSEIPYFTAVPVHRICRRLRLAWLDCEGQCLCAPRFSSKVRPSCDTIRVTESRHARETALGLGDDADQARARQQAEDAAELENRRQNWAAIDRLVGGDAMTRLSHILFTVPILLVAAIRQQQAVVTGAWVVYGRRFAGARRPVWAPSGYVDLGAK
jgi:hypothetical protein